jgi:hypothetical protein
VLLPQKDALGPLDRSGRAALPKQTADNADRNDVENRADHHAAQSAEQYEDVELTKQHPDHHSADEGAKDAGDREAPRKPDIATITHVC